MPRKPRPMFENSRDDLAETIITLMIFALGAMLLAIIAILILQIIQAIGQL
jgi:hypothetical protein